MMNYIFTNNSQEQWQLERQFSQKNGYFVVPQNQSDLIAQMFNKITYEFFQNKIPMIVQKIKQMLKKTLNSSYSLDQYRQIMEMIRKEHQNMEMYREHLIAMNRAFAEDDLQLLVNHENEQQNQDQIFQEAMKGEKYQYADLQLLYELPIKSQLEFKVESDTNTEKTVKSELQWTEIALNQNQIIAGMGTNKLQNFFAVSGDVNNSIWKLSRRDSTCQDTSREMKSFDKKKSNILSANLDIAEIVQKEMRYDLSRQITLGSGIMQGLQSPRTYNHQKKIKDNLRNIKLRMRRK